MASSSKIVTHQRFDRPQVVQQPRRGRLPKAVPSVLIYGRDKRVRAFVENAARARADELEKMLAEEERFVNHLRYELALALQKVTAA